ALFFELLPYASDDNLIAFTQALVRHMGILGNRNSYDCYFYVNPDKLDPSAFNAMTERYKELFDEEGQLEARILSEYSGKNRSIPGEKEVASSLNQVMSALRGRFGDSVDLLSAENVAPERYRAYCEVLTSMYTIALKLPPQKTAQLLRHLYAQ